MIAVLVRRNIAANSGRLMLMMVSIILGVSFVSGSFLLADSLRDVFGRVTETAFAGLDVQVQAADNELRSGFERPRFSDDVIELIEDLPEVAHIEPNLNAAFQIFVVANEGEETGRPDPPILATSWGGSSVIAPFKLVQGAAPSGDEIAIDAGQAERYGLSVGDQAKVSAPGLDQLLSVTVAGIVTFGEVDLGGALVNLFDLDTMQRLLDADGEVAGIGVARSEGVRVDELITAIEGVLLPDDTLEVVTGPTVAQERIDGFNEIIDILGYILLGFALVVLVVSVFIIYNTFSILVAQRVRQFGLLRCVGVSDRQLTNMVLAEALIVGVVASAIGLVGGVAIAEILKMLFAAGGGDFPDGRIIFKARTILVVVGLGIGVTVGSALLPARMARSTSAIAALRSGAVAVDNRRGRRVFIGTVLTATGLVLMGSGLFLELPASQQLGALGVGALMLFVGVAAVSVVFASKAVRGIGRPIETVIGLNGRLARDNASRSPGRTAATATGLMVGLALVTGFLVLTQSLRQSLDTVLDEAVAADLFVFDDSQNLPFPGAAFDSLAQVPELGAVAGVAPLRVAVDGEVEVASGFDLPTGDSIIDIGMVSGRQDAGKNGVLVSLSEAQERNLQTGDLVDVRFEDDYMAKFAIMGVFKDDSILGTDWIFDRQYAAERQDQKLLLFVGIAAADGVSIEAARLAASDAVANFPQLSVANNAEFKEVQEGQINSVLYLVFGLLGLCIVVAFLGIVNTMALSIMERTREIGLLRAIGLSSRQLRSMVRWEAGIVGVFGALLGVGLGTLLGISAVAAIPDSFVSETSIPWAWTVALTVLGGVLGIVAAYFPANRASKMNMLEAISSN